MRNQKMKVLYLGSNENKNAGKEKGQDWSNIFWKGSRKWKVLT